MMDLNALPPGLWLVFGSFAGGGLVAAFMRERNNGRKIERDAVLKARELDEAERVSLSARVQLEREQLAHAWDQFREESTEAHAACRAEVADLRDQVRQAKDSENELRREKNDLAAQVTLLTSEIKAMRRNIVEVAEGSPLTMRATDLASRDHESG